MDNRVLKGLDIEIFNLQIKTYYYDFVVDDKFFQEFEDSLIRNGRAAINVELKKSAAFIELKLKIEGNIGLICDRSLEEFDYPIALEHELIFKFGDEYMELDDFMVQISKNTERIHLAQFVYEFITLAIPMKKLHPRFSDVEDEEGIVVYTSKTDSDQGDEEKTLSDSNNVIDPRWQKLNELRNNKK